MTGTYPQAAFSLYSRSFTHDADARHCHPRKTCERDWQPEVARLARATIQGDLVTVHNIRNFDYRTE